ncbi:MAG: hypothetical protein ABIT09_00820 [Croceibacterium sp.]
MVWNPMPQPQQCGAQLPRGGAPAEAVAGRGAQQNDEADQQLGGIPTQGTYPASEPENSGQDNTPTAPKPSVAWDDVVQPEQACEPSGPADPGEPLPEGQ